MHLIPDIDSAINNEPPEPLEIAYEVHRCTTPVFTPGLLDPVRSAFIVRYHELGTSLALSVQIKKGGGTICYPSQLL